MKASLKGLPNEPRGGAWPSSARAVTGQTVFWLTCSKSVQLSLVTSETCIRIYEQILMDDCVQYGNCLRKKEEGAGYGRSVCPKSPGLHARNNGRDNGIRPRKRKLNL